MAFNSYSFAGEDMMLRVLLEIDGIKINTNGFYVDVGAHHPRRFSNKMFFSELGWSGINIDPNQGIKALFEKERPNDKFFEIALGDKTTKKQFFTYNEPALNSLINRDQEMLNTPYIPSGQKEVQVSNLKTILSDNLITSIPTPNFLDIDVEGFELEVLKGNDWNKYRFSYILVEQKVKNFESIIDCPITIFLKNLSYEPVSRNHITTIFKDFKK